MTEDPAFLWRNGAIVPWSEATVHVNAVGHASASAVFEGLVAYRGNDGSLRIFRGLEHMRRIGPEGLEHKADRLIRSAVEIADQARGAAEGLHRPALAGRERGHGPEQEPPPLQGRRLHAGQGGKSGEPDGRDIAG